MRSNAEHLLMVPSVARERFLDRGWGHEIYSLVLPPNCLASASTGHVHWE